MNEDELRQLHERALGALADIAFSHDMTLAVAKAKAKRIYEEIRARDPDGKFF
jgi:hypothetical protein